MKTIKPLFLMALLFTIFTTCKEGGEEVEELRSALINLDNLAGAGACLPTEESVTFILSYGEIQQDVDVEDQIVSIIVNVTDGQSINVRVQRTSDATLLSNADVSVRTTSRPAALENEIRTISYCTVFDLMFRNF